MNKGFILLHRKLLDGDIWNSLSDAQTRAWIGLMLLVNYEPHEWNCKCGLKIEVPAGGTIISGSNMAKRLDISRSVMRHTINKLKDLDFLAQITHKSRTNLAQHKHTLTTINNWEKYQFPKESRTNLAQISRKNGPELNNITNKQIKDVVETSVPTSTFDPPKVRKIPTLESQPSEAIRITEGLRRAILLDNPQHRISDEKRFAPHRVKWANDIRLLHERDKISWDRIKDVVNWLANNDFWITNIQSGGKLRKQFDRLESLSRKEL